MEVMFVEFDAEETPAPVALCWHRRDPRLKVAGAVFLDIQIGVVVFTHRGTSHDVALTAALDQHALQLSEASESGGGEIMVDGEEVSIDRFSTTLGNRLPSSLLEPALAYARQKMGK